MDRRNRHHQHHRQLPKNHRRDGNFGSLLAPENLLKTAPFLAGRAGLGSSATSWRAICLALALVAGLLACLKTDRRDSRSDS
ncbi:MAG: hypothetical protein HS114_13930 [Anaerolineales bacterium]|nr:hypothetical protein [Anaerolineales bacterium]